MFAICRGLLVIQLMFVASSLLEQSHGVFHQGETSGKGHNREKRESEAINGLKEEERRVILDFHNLLRSFEQASSVTDLLWDPELEKLAQNYADQCKFEHNSNRTNVAGFQYVGENLYVGEGDFEPQLIIAGWYGEITHYDYSSGTCAAGKVCGDYTQIVWANSTAVGCGVKSCPRLAGSIALTEGILFVCNYGPGPRNYGTIGSTTNSIVAAATSSVKGLLRNERLDRSAIVRPLLARVCADEEEKGKGEKRKKVEENAPEQQIKFQSIDCFKDLHGLDRHSCLESRRLRLKRSMHN